MASWRARRIAHLEHSLSETSFFRSRDHCGSLREDNDPCSSRKLFTSLAWLFPRFDPADLHDRLALRVGQGRCR